MSQRLNDLLSAIRREGDPAVRGRAAALLLKDLEAARAEVSETLDDAIRELRAGGLPRERVEILLGLPCGTGVTAARRFPRAVDR